MDILKQLGELAIASRMKRLSERFVQDVALVYKDMAIDYEPRWFSVYYLLTQKAPLSIVDIAGELGISHACVNQVAGELIRNGLVEELRDAQDKRRRLLKLSAMGEALLPELTPTWGDIERAAREVVHSTGMDVLAVLERLENALDQQSFYQRIMRQMKTRQFTAVEIVPYAPKYTATFEHLNREWLESQIPADWVESVIVPKAEAVLAAGGEIWFAKLGVQVVGTCAMLPHAKDCVQLAHMAVSPDARGKQIGKALLAEAIQRAKSQGIQQMILGTHSKLTPAMRLYRQAGFTICPSILQQFSPSSWVDTAMVLQITAPVAEALCV